MMTLQIFLLVYFQCFYLLELFVFAYLLILSGLKVKNYLKINILIIKNYSSYYKIVIESLKIKTKSNYNWDDIVYVYDIDVKLIKVIKRESKIGVDIYYIGYAFDSEYKNHSIKSLYLLIKLGSSDRYLVVNINNKKIINIFDKIWKYIEQRIISNGIWKFVEDEIIFDNENNDIKEYNKLRFSSDLDLPSNTLIEFRALTLTISCVIEKDGEYYPEIYLMKVFTYKITSYNIKWTK